MLETRFHSFFLHQNYSSMHLKGDVWLEEECIFRAQWFQLLYCWVGKLTACHKAQSCSYCRVWGHIILACQLNQVRQPGLGWFRVVVVGKICCASGYCTLWPLAFMLGSESLECWGNSGLKKRRHCKTVSTATKKSLIPALQNTPRARAEVFQLAC